MGGDPLLMTAEFPLIDRDFFAMSGYAGTGGGGGHYDDGYAQQGHGDSYYQDEHAQGYYDNQGYGDGYYDQG